MTESAAVLLRAGLAVLALIAAVQGVWMYLAPAPSTTTRPRSRPAAPTAST